MWLSLVAGGLTLGGILVRLGRVLERQETQTGQLVKHDQRLDDLEDGHGHHDTAFEALKGEMNGLRGAMDSLGGTIERMIVKLDRHLENQN